ncbi:MAG: hypothetical protein GX573_16990, partial [Chloroflexi bacterium]|nr:hypothetical protein [Chloroflexota bacterium]
MPDDSNAIPHDVIQRRYSNLDTETPVLLLPYRIETRFSPQRDRLRIRIYPDQIHIDSHNVPLTPKEIALGQAFWLRTWAAPDDETERDAAWAALVDVLGSRRAAWVARSLRPKGTPSPRDLLGDVKKLFPEVPVGNPGPARARLLPDHWCVHGYLDGERVLDEVISVPEDSLVVAPDLTDPDSLPDDGPPVDAAAEWTVDFQAALGKGMALDIPLTGKYAKIRNRGLDELIVFGLRPDDRQGDPAALADLLAAHLYTDGIAFVPRDTPTNNTEAVTTGWTPGDDTVGIYERELTDAYATAPDGSVARDLIDALALPASAAPARMLHGEFLGDAAASAMNQLLWPITGGIYLETVIRGIDEAPVSDSHIREAHDWLVKYVRGGGPLPALRVAAIPYGVLPVQYINGERDATTKYRYIERVIGELRHTWRDSLEDVPRMVPLVSRTGGTYENDGAPTDADAEILTILSSQPNPAQYSTRRLPLEYADTTLGVTSVFNLIVELMKLLQYPSDLDRVLERKLGEEWITTIEDQISAVEDARQDVQDDADILEDMLEGRIPLVGDEDEVRAQYEYITGPYGTLYWFDSILLPYLQDHLTRTEPLREIYLDTFPTGLIGEDDPAIFYSRYDDEPVQWPPDAPVIEASQGQAADYLEWLRQYAEALLHGDPAPESLSDLPDSPPLLYQLLKQSIERTAERDASAYGLFYSMAGALTTRSGLQAPPADRAGRIESVHRTASRATAGQLRAFDTFLKGTKDPNRDTPVGHAVRAIPLDDLTQMAHDVAAAAEITALGPAKQRALLDLSGTLEDVVAWRKDEGIVVGHDDWWDQIPNQFPRPGAPSLGDLAEALAILRDMPAERLAHLLPETIGLFGHRLDAWATSLAYERLLAMRQKNPRTLYVGGFAWVEKLAPADAPPSQGHILAPSLTHAATAAILRSGWSSRGTPEASSLLATNLRSDRVRLANDLLDGMRQGQRLEDLLGYIFERLLMGDGKLADGSDAPGGKHVWIDPMRKAFGGGTVVDGLALVDARLARTVAQRVRNPPGPLAEIAAEMDAVVAAFDAAGDLLLAESMYQLVQGNLDRAGAALDAAATGEILPPALQVVETPSAGVGVDHRLFVVLTGTSWEHA